jgi:putative FmdB family regulatory protein
MPFYEYQCKSCEHHLEVLQKVSDPPLRKCPHCGKQQLQRLISAPVFRLKGSGWYETDFKSDKESKRNLVGSESTDSGDRENVKPPETKADKADAPVAKDAKADAKSESKSDAKTESKPAPKETKSTSAAKSSRSKPASKPKKKVARR